MFEREIDLPELLTTLGLDPSAPVAPVEGGADTAIWHVRHAGAAYALRLYRPGEGAVMRREIAAMATAATMRVPTPGVCAEAVWRDRSALLLDWMPGQRLDRALQTAPWLAWRLGNAFGHTQARIHRAPVPTELREDGRPWIDWAEPADALRNCLVAVASDAECPLHLDYHPRNVLVDAGGVTAVLDWTNARAGDPRADLARTASILRFAPRLAGLPAPVAVSVVRWFAAGWRRGYRDVAGPMRGMAPFYAWAGAVMVRDLSPRLGRPDLPWITPDFLDGVQRWSDSWLERACARDGRSQR